MVPPSRVPVSVPTRAVPPFPGQLADRVPSPRPRPVRRPSPAVARRRRLLVAVVFTVLVALPALAGVELWSDGAAASDPDGATVEVIVGPGDTVWDIARELQPTGDVRGLVHELTEAAGGPVLQPGQRLSVAAPR